MKFDLVANFIFSSEISKIKNEIECTISIFNKTLLVKDKSIKIDIKNLEQNSLILNISSEGIFRPHNALLQLKNVLSKELGKKHQLGIREIKIKGYSIDFELEKQPLKVFSIPFADLEVNGKKIKILLKNVDEEFLQGNYIDRMINLVKKRLKINTTKVRGSFGNSFGNQVKKELFGQRIQQRKWLNSIGLNKDQQRVNGFIMLKQQLL